MPRGKVKTFNEKKGYGFITPTDGSPDVFVHFSNIYGDGFKTLNQGDMVEYGVQETERGQSATNVRRV